MHTPTQNRQEFEAPPAGSSGQVVQIEASTTPDKSGNNGVDVESLVMRMHNKMKTLESRYLDLANFYKKELLHGRERTQSSI